jgi:hypothetical protein
MAQRWTAKSRYESRPERHTTAVTGTTEAVVARWQKSVAGSQGGHLRLADNIL